MTTRVSKEQMIVRSFGYKSYSKNQTGLEFAVTLPVGRPMCAEARKLLGFDDASRKPLARRAPRRRM